MGKTEEIKEPRRQILDFEEVRSGFFYARDETFKMQKKAENQRGTRKQLRDECE